MEFPYLPACISFAVVLFFFHEYLNVRQYWAFHAAKPHLESHMSQDEHDKACAYGRDKLRFVLLTTTVKFWIELGLVIWCYPLLWAYSGTLRATYFPGGGEFTQSVILMAIVEPIAIVEHFTFNLYFDFVIEERHGFNKKTIALFIVDWIKTEALKTAIGLPVLWVVIRLIRWGGPTFYIYVWAFAVIFSLLMMVIYPFVIAPLFNKYEKLHDDVLRASIEDLARSLKFPLTEIYQIDGSIRSAHSNAFFYGFWKAKRIVLYDTLLSMEHPQILAVLGHELGHWSMKHTTYGMVLGFIQLFAVFFLYGFVMDNEPIFKSFGYTVDPSVDHTINFSVVVGFMIFDYIFTPVSTLVGVMMTSLTRVFEFQADKFAVTLGRGDKLIEALEELEKQNKTPAVFDWLYAWWHYSHPPTVERVKYIKSLMKKGD